MFIYSAKMDKKKLLTLLACGGIAVLVLVLVLCRGCGGERSASSVVGTENVEVAAAPKSVAKLIKKARINTPEDAAELLTELGWTVEPSPVETVDVVIPAVFSDVYEKYNELQLTQGFDLTRHAGKTATRWTMSITNHPSGEEEVYATLLVINSRIVGGDVCAARLDGFMHGLTPESYGGEVRSSAEIEPSSPETSVPQGK